eukprot:TRINITY_DN5075_c0_g1_i1.p1 TRINITY_DN5075_c0_g1~~TRINITY_DN5075_c0_g1_i1.p1  ORF type:complete len:297 (+),score=63.05 TRINITY_DN5075_c0_g1_i1:77-967(+)
MSESKKVRVLITNDDGIMAEGMLALVRVLWNTGRFDLRVACPATEQSGVSQSITLHRPIYASLYHLDKDPLLKDILAYQVEGTPADCVKLALTALYVNWSPDLVISGINNGLNSGTSLLYSGTVGGATEGLLNGLNSIAVSLDHSVRHCPTLLYTSAAELLLPIIDSFLAFQLSSTNKKKENWFLLNVNVPNREKKDIKGVKITRQGVSGFREFHSELEADEKEAKPTGDSGPTRRKFQLRGKIAMEDEDEDIDIVALKQGFVSVTPIGLFRTFPNQQEIRDQLASAGMTNCISTS